MIIGNTTDKEVLYWIEHPEKFVEEMFGIKLTVLQKIMLRFWPRHNIQNVYRNTRNKWLYCQYTKLDGKIL